MRTIAEAEAGVVIILRYEQSARQLVHDIAALGKSDSVQAVEPSKDEVAVLRTHGTGAQILRDLGITRMRVLSAPKHMLALSGFGLEVVEYVDH
jgi:3,4-dihydroxy 2-butanone 4-phosphate synthase/GTP cyclohydrolase II